jgi:hypothetical protein
MNAQALVARDLPRIRVRQNPSQERLAVDPRSKPNSDVQAALQSTTCSCKGITVGKITGTQHGDAANQLLVFYEDKVHELELSGQYFMAAIALALALETAVLTYLLVEFGEENGGELKIPGSVNMSELIAAANEIDVLNAPINIPSHVGEDENETCPKHIAKDVVDKIRRFRNLIHPARALKESFDPRTFTQEQLQGFKEMYESILHSLLYYI